MQSELLTQFYRAYAGWLDAGAPRLPLTIFSRDSGLCRNLRLWLNNVGKLDYYRSLRREMEEQFSPMNVLYPFNGNSWAYQNEREAEKCHLNEQRIKWVRDHAQL